MMNDFLRPVLFISETRGCILLKICFEHFKASIVHYMTHILKTPFYGSKLGV